MRLVIGGGDEVMNFVESKYKIRPQIKYLDNNSFKLIIGAPKLPVSFPFLTCTSFVLPITFDVTIEISEARGHRVVLGYKCGRFVQAIIAETIKCPEDKLPDGVSMDVVNQKICIDLTRIQKDGAIFERIDLKGVFIEDRGFVVDFDFS